MSLPVEKLNQIGRHLVSRAYHHVTIGSKFSPSFKRYLQLPNGEIGSYFHDVPVGLNSKNKTCNMVVEVPRWTNGKFEINVSEKLNPITQDIKKGTPRFINNIFPYHGYIHNYGAIPQTWEQPNVEVLQGLKGDNDPLDCCEIGSAVAGMGDIKTVKILGSLALIDDGELDWKVICIDINDPLAHEINTLVDVDTHMPGLLEATRNWFRDYKIPTGKPANSFAFDGEYQDCEQTIKTIEECHSAWESLINKEVTNLGECPSIARAGSNVAITSKQEPDTKIPSDCDKWSYL